VPRKRHRLAQRRKAVGLSQERLAEIIGVDRITVGRWERADNEPQPWFRPRLAHALKVSVEELAALLADIHEVREAPADDALEIRSVAELIGTPSQWTAGQRHLGLLEGIAGVAAASGLLDGHQPAGTRRLGANDVARLNAVTALYRSVDYEWGGGLLYDHVARFAESTSALVDQLYADTLTPALLSAVAAARQLAGWTAFDSCQYSDAQRHFLSAERAAVAADDVLLAAMIRDCRARQFQHLRHNQDALDTLRLARDQLGSRATPAVSALLYGTEAASLAALGDRPAACAALGNARDEFDRIKVTREPEWMRFYNQGELFAQYGRVYRDLARVDRKHGPAAVHWVTEAISAFGPQNARSTILNEVGLCSALFLAGLPQNAIGVGALVIEHARQLTSHRIFDRIRNIRRDLSDHRSAPDVEDFRHALAAVGA
jgi:transcriptional regulator with XRE-family HTH domain